MSRATGLHEGDVIVGINGAAVRAASQVEDLLNVRSGEVIRVYIERDSQITFTDLADTSTVLRPAQQEQVAQALENDAQVLSNTQLEQRLPRVQVIHPLPLEHTYDCSRSRRQSPPPTHPLGTTTGPTRTAPLPQRKRRPATQAALSLRENSSNGG